MRTAVRRLTVTGPVRPVVAWHRYDDLAAWSGWAPQIVSVDADGPTLARGRHGVVTTTFGLQVPFVVTDVDAAAMTWSWVAALGPLHLTLHHDVGAGPRGTRAGLAVEGPAVLVTGYAPLARLALRRLVAP